MGSNWTKLGVAAPESNCGELVTTHTSPLNPRFKLWGFNLLLRTDKSNLLLQTMC